MHIERALIIALEAHAGQVDKGGHPYILHSLRVMLAAETDDERVVAILHDVIEDSAWTIEALRAEGLTDGQALGLDAVSRRDGEAYDDFIIRAGNNPIGKAVKILDLKDNCDLSRLTTVSKKDRDRARKYQAALTVISN